MKLALHVGGSRKRELGDNSTAAWTLSSPMKAGGLLIIAPSDTSLIAQIDWSWWSLVLVDCFIASEFCPGVRRRFLLVVTELEHEGRAQSCARLGMRRNVRVGDREGGHTPGRASWRGVWWVPCACGCPVPVSAMGTFGRCPRRHASACGQPWRDRAILVCPFQWLLTHHIPSTPPAPFIHPPSAPLRQRRLLGRPGPARWEAGSGSASRPGRRRHAGRAGRPAGPLPPAAAAAPGAAARPAGAGWPLREGGVQEAQGRGAGWGPALPAGMGGKCLRGAPWAGGGPGGLLSSSRVLCPQLCAYKRIAGYMCG